MTSDYQYMNRFIILKRSIYILAILCIYFHFTAVTIAMLD